MRQPPQPPDELTARLIEQAEAGAQLFYAIYHLREDVVRALFRDASPGLLRAYQRATAAYQRGAGSADQ